MSKPNQQKSHILHPLQRMFNDSYDHEFGINTTEIIGYDGTNLQRVKTDSTGKLQVDMTSGFEIPEYDNIVLTYVASGNGVGEVETATYSLASTDHTVLTMTYNADGEISNVAKTTL